MPLAWLGEAAPPLCPWSACGNPRGARSVHVAAASRRSRAPAALARLAGRLLAKMPAHLTAGLFARAGLSGASELSGHTRWQVCQHRPAGLRVLRHAGCRVCRPGPADRWRSRGQRARRGLGWSRGPGTTAGRWRADGRPARGQSLVGGRVRVGPLAGRSKALRRPSS
jgi:hypothetical protein